MTAATDITRARSRRKEGKTAELESLARRLGFRSLASCEAANDILFASVFLLTRILGYGAGLAHLLHALAAGRYEALDQAPRALMVGLIVCGFILNLSWMRRIVSAVQRSEHKQS